MKNIVGKVSSVSSFLTEKYNYIPKMLIKHKHVRSGEILWIWFSIKMCSVHYLSQVIYIWTVWQGSGYASDSSYIV